MKTMDPNNVQMNGYVHEKLPPAFLARVKATTDVFQSVDGISYEQAVDLYRRDLDPEANLVIWEEMAKVYKTFCIKRCTTAAEKMDVYRALLIRSMFSEKESMARINPQAISRAEAERVIRQYKLQAKPIDLYKQ